MTLDEALNELGIDHEADAEGARRAYLRLLKKRKPEVDRDGFMRLREAYELAKPYFEQVEMFRALEKAASAAPTGDDGASERVRIVTPAGVVWVQTNRQPPTDAPPVADQPTVGDDKPFVEKNVVEASEPPPIVQTSPVDEPRFELPPSEPEQPPIEPAAQVPADESSEPSITELIAAGKLKKAARRAGREYREAVQQGALGLAVPAPYQTVSLLLRLHEKNRVEEARTLEKDFADWLSSTGAAVRIMAGPVGVKWMIARELSAVSNSFPSELRTGIAKAVLADKLDEMQRRADWYQMSDPAQARDAALDLHAHAPTLANLLGETLSPSPRRAPPARSNSSGGTWGIGILAVALLQLVRLFASSPSSSPTTYRGQSDPAAYVRPSPPPPPDSKPTSLLDAFDAGPAVDDSVKLDKATQDKLLKLADQLAKAAEKTEPDVGRLMVQRAIYIRSAIENGRCSAVEVELNGFVTDMVLVSDPLKKALLPITKKIDQMLTAACAKKDPSKMLKDGGTKKP